MSEGTRAMRYEAAANAHRAGDYQRAMGLWESAHKHAVAVEDKAARVLCGFMKDWEYFCAALVEGESMEIEGTLRDFLWPDFNVLQREMKGVEEWSSWREFEAPKRLFQACLLWGYYDGPIVQAALAPLDEHLNRGAASLDPALNEWRQILLALSLRTRKIPETWGLDTASACAALAQVGFHSSPPPQSNVVARATALLTLARWKKDGGFAKDATKAYQKLIELTSEGIQMIQAVARRELEHLQRVMARATAQTK